MIIGCVVLIAFGGDSNDGDSDKAELIPDQSFNLAIAIIFALCTGLVFSLQPLTMKYSMDVGFDFDQSWYDCQGFMSIGLAPFFLYYVFTEENAYSSKNILYAFVAITLCNFGIICIGKGIQCGHAGPVQAIENSKTIVQTVTVVIITSQLPTVMQIGGLLVGLLGVFVIVC